MILKSITLRNIRSYRDQRISFPEGSILLAGDIGSGKSSVLHSVEFALFGARRDSISGEALLRKGENDGEVRLVFDLDGREVTVSRRLKRQRGSVAQDAGFLVVDGKRVEGTATEIKARLLDLLGYPGELLTKSNSLVYRYTVYTPQEEMKHILMESDEMRIDTLRKVFGIDRYKRIAENAMIYVRSIKEQKKELLGVMHGLDEKRADLAKRKDSLARKEFSGKQLLPMLEQVRKRKDAKKDELAEVEQGVKELNELKKRVEVCDARLMEIVKSRAKNREELESAELQAGELKRKLEGAFLEERQYPPLEDVENEISSMEKGISSLSSRKVELAERRRSIHERIERLVKDQEVKNGKTAVLAAKETLYNALLEELQDKKNINSVIDDVNRRLRESENIISELTVKQKNSELLKEEITSLDTCPTCRQEVSEVHKRSIVEEEERKLRKTAAELDELLSQKKDIERKLGEHNQKLEAFNEKEKKLAAVKVELSNLRSIKSELDELVRLREALDKEKENIMGELEKLDDTIIDKMRDELEQKKALLKEINSYNLLLKEKKHNLAMLAEKEKRREELSKLQEQLKEEVRKINSDKMRLAGEIAKMASVEERFRQKKDELDLVAEEEKDMSVRLAEMNKDVEGAKEIVASLQKDVEHKESAERRFNSLNSVQEWLEKMFVSLMSTMERQIMAKVHTQFSELFSSWFNLLIEDGNISVRIDDSFSPVITQNGYDTDLAHLSGGEKTSVALAYRLALNRVINDIISSIRTRDILILDEPTDGFSSEQLDKVRTVLDELNVKQTIIVSHESKIESFVDHVIRIHKTEHVSRVVS
ncbi:SMC family ATPase [Candidatus Woesearchaeota archaeon]|nr:SMC family ATPase [Candidatus Woesearchaeota archaeon]